MPTFTWFLEIAVAHKHYVCVYLSTMAISTKYSYCFKYHYLNLAINIVNGCIVNACQTKLR